MNMKHTFISVMVVLMLALPLQQAFAHGGGLDRYGCHRETATGGYHCHDDEDDDQDWEAAALILGGLIVLVIILAQINEDDDHAFTETKATSSSRLEFVTQRPGISENDEFEPYLGLRYRVGF